MAIKKTVDLTQDPRLGTLDTRPSVTVSGKPISAQPSTMRLGGDYWGFLDDFSDNAEEVETLKALIKANS